MVVLGMAPEKQQQQQKRSEAEFGVVVSILRFRSQMLLCPLVCIAVWTMERQALLDV
jgi:hypothetical protein